jgi:hypothetical protein
MGCGDAEDDEPLSSSGPTPCAVYCGLMARNCTHAALQYADLDACLTTCATFAPGSTTYTDRADTLSCRMAFAATANKRSHRLGFCRNAGPTGGNACGP